MSFATAIDQSQVPAGGTAGAAEAADPERLKVLAAQFESMLVAQMLQQMRAALFDEGDAKEMGAGPLADSLFAELSLAISRSGGVGLANSMMAPLTRQASQSVAQAGAEGPAPVTSRLDAAPDVRAARISGGLDAVATTLAEPFPSIAGRMSSAYGWRRDPMDESLKFHKGIDIAMPVGQGIPAPRAGRVAFAGEQAGYGLTVVLEHDGQLTTRFAHLSEISVKAGDEVSAGQIMARSGATGRATGPHLHFEVLESGRNVNPAERLAPYTTGRPQ